jgi:hypothetical protein
VFALACSRLEKARRSLGVTWAAMNCYSFFSASTPARVAKLADARDLKSRVPKGTYRFNSGPGHHRHYQPLY